MAAQHRTAALTLTVIGIKYANGFVSENQAKDQQAPDLPLSVSSSTVLTVQVAIATLVAVGVVVMFLAVAWRRHPSFSTAIFSAASSVLTALGGRRRVHVPSNVRHRLRLRMPIIASDVAFNGKNYTPSLASANDSPSASVCWAPQMLTLHAKKQQLQQARKDSGDAAMIKPSESHTSMLMSMMMSDPSRQQTPSDLLPIEMDDPHLPYFVRRLELLPDD